MNSPSARTASERPFYDARADVYDSIVIDPVAPWVDAVEALLAAHGIVGANLLDAGCGTGRHAEAFTGLGHRVTLLDASAKLLTIAAARCPGSPAHLDDVCDPELTGPFDVVTCRGVLNDLLTDTERDAALRSFARLLRSGGVLALDVREAGRSRARADGRERTRAVTLPAGGVVTFTSRTTWQQEHLVVEERHEVESARSTQVDEFEFRMRPWTVDEVHDRLTANGFAAVRIAAGVGGRDDRIFVTALAG